MHAPSTGVFVGLRPGTRWVKPNELPSTLDGIGGQLIMRMLSREENLYLEEKITSLLVPDPVPAGQYSENFQNRPLWLPERRLMLAVLDDAIMCYQKYVTARKGKGNRLFRKAQEWIFEEESDRFFSFESVCVHLGVDPNYIRRGLAQWRMRALRRLKKARGDIPQRRLNRVDKKRQLRPAA